MSSLSYRTTKQAQAVARHLRPVPNTRHDREIALRMLAVAIANYHAAATSPTEVRLRAVNELSEAERTFFERAAQQAMQVLWTGN